MADLFDDYFSTTRDVPVVLSDLGPVGEDVMRYFTSQEYAVSGTRLANGGWHISMHKGDWFRTILGLKTALNVTIEPIGEVTRVKASVGIFELQALPTIITIFVFAPVIFGQIWGIIQQSKLDEEAVRYVEDCLAYYAGMAGTAPDTARAVAEAELGEPAI